MSGISSVYPPPPWYYKHFTEENLEKLKEEISKRTSQEPVKQNELATEETDDIGLPEATKPIENTDTTDAEPTVPTDSIKAEPTESTETKETNIPSESGSAPLLTQPTLPFPLNLLEPPSRPSDFTSYRGFGNVWQIDDKLLPLEEVGIRQLYQDIGNSANSTTGTSGDNAPSSISVQANHQEQIWELKKLLKSVLISFLELVGIMSTAPEKFPAKVEDIRIILINMHHLLNEYRPHQARESLVLLMEDQIQSRQQEIESLKESNASIQNQITILAQQLTGILTETTSNAESLEDQMTTNSITGSTSATGERQNRDLILWELLSKEGITP